MSSDAPNVHPRPKLLDRVWMGVAAVVVIAGIVFAALFVPAGTALAAATDGVLVAVVALGVRQSALVSLGHSDRRALARRLRRGILGGAVAAVTLAGLVRMAGPAALLIVMVLCVSCPRLWVAVRAERVRSPRGLHDEPNVPPCDEESIRRLSRSALCALWQASCAELERADSALQVEQVCDRRRAVLDELARRDPGVSRWLKSGARADSDPSRYLRA